MYVGMYVCICVEVYAHECMRPEEVLDPLFLELQVVVSHLIEVGFTWEPNLGSLD